MNREIKFRVWDGTNMLYMHQPEYRGEFYFSFKESGKISVTHYHGETEHNEHINVESLMQYTGLKDKNGVEIYEGDIVAEEQVYHFIDREGWEPEKKGKWIIIGEKVKNFTGKKEERYVAGYCNIMVIEWNVKSAGYEPFSDSMENCGHCGGGDNPADYIVLGNIHQHPELLNS